MSPLALTDPPEMQDVEVRETHRQRGVASALTAEVESHARAHGAHELQIAVSVDNRAATPAGAGHGAHPHRPAGGG